MVYTVMSVNLTPQKSAIFEATGRKTDTFKGNGLAVQEKTIWQA